MSSVCARIEFSNNREHPETIFAQLTTITAYDMITDDEIDDTMDCEFVGSQEFWILPTYMPKG